MVKYIDAGKLIAKIERLKNQTERRLDNIVPIRKKDTMDEEQLAKIELRDKVDKAYLNGVLITLSDVLSCITSLQQEQPSLPSDIDEAAWKYAMLNPDYQMNRLESFKAGAEWLARQGWIDDGSMPPETKHEGNTMQGHREWTESEPVLAWDSMYGPRVDVTKNGKWMSEQRGGYTGQICHGIIAWRPIPEYKEKQ